jgi:hypothetical protein
VDIISREVTVAGMAVSLSDGADGISERECFLSFRRMVHRRTQASIGDLASIWFRSSSDNEAVPESRAGTTPGKLSSESLGRQRLQIRNVWSSHAPLLNAH